MGPALRHDKGKALAATCQGGDPGPRQPSYRHPGPGPGGHSARPRPVTRSVAPDPAEVAPKLTEEHPPRASTPPPRTAYTRLWFTPKQWLSYDPTKSLPRTVHMLAVAPGQSRERRQGAAMAYDMLVVSYDLWALPCSVTRS
ncbi:hypothetical protein SGA01_77500 [Streptomyces gardneri]|uniref:Uncharacterized protein n=1 Tax=Streptomyces gardneri TaxID=66892 RepID=A0A4Y3RXK3_9ACTN|nr:hypothetical protein SGA01_77500 [Streptomyces gardneri]